MTAFRMDRLSFLGPKSHCNKRPHRGQALGMGAGYLLKRGGVSAASGLCGPVWSGNVKERPLNHKGMIEVQNDWTVKNSLRISRFAL